MGKEPLYAIYPADGVAIADPPIGFIDHGRGPRVETFFNELVAYLRSHPCRSALPIPAAAFHWEMSRPKRDPNWNFDPTRLVTAIRMPEPAVICQALDLYQGALRKPSLTARCLDFSGSMAGKGESQLQAASSFCSIRMKPARYWQQWTPADRIMVIPSTVACGQPFGDRRPGATEEPCRQGVAAACRWRH